MKRGSSILPTVRGYEQVSPRIAPSWTLSQQTIIGGGKRDVPFALAIRIMCASSKVILAYTSRCGKGFGMPTSYGAQSTHSIHWSIPHVVRLVTVSLNISASLDKDSINMGACKWNSSSSLAPGWTPTGLCTIHTWFVAINIFHCTTEQVIHSTVTGDSSTPLEAFCRLHGNCTL